MDSYSSRLKLLFHQVEEEDVTIRVIHRVDGCNTPSLESKIFWVIVLSVWSTIQVMSRKPSSRVVVC